MEYISPYNTDLFKIEGKTAWQGVLAKPMAKVISVYPDSFPWSTSQPAGHPSPRFISPELKIKQLKIGRELCFLLACETQNCLLPMSAKMT